MRTKNLIFSIALCCLLCSTLSAQNSRINSATNPTQDRSIAREDCRSNAGPEDVAYERTVDRALFKQQMDNYLRGINQRALVQYAVQFHIVRRDDGTGGADIADIRGEMEDYINPYFADLNVEFVECNPELYHNSTEYYVLGNGDEDPDAAGDAMAVAFNVPNVINIYYVSDPDGACGWARFPWKLPADYIVIANSCADNQSTTVHELGHYFGLYHTHETANGAESVTRNNADGCYDCDTDGDLLCDTPADPNLSEKANDWPSCAYTGTDTDACNGDSYSPAIDNIMSYADKECRTIFTAGQLARMEVYRVLTRFYLQTGCPCEKPVAVCKNITVDLNAAGNASITPSSVDNGSTYDCGLSSMSVSPSFFDCDDTGGNAVTLTITDDLGWVDKCNATVTIRDVTDPVITTEASDMTVECDGEGNALAFENWVKNNGGAVATDACGGAWTENSTGLSDGCGATGSETVTFTYTDPSGNSASTTATFTIEDNTDPDLTCPDDIHLPECVPTATWTVESSDICGDVTVVSDPPSGSFFAKGTTTTVTVTSTDECGNESVCTFEVTRDPDLEVAIDPVATSPLNTCALGTGAHIVLGYGGGPSCVTLSATASGGHGPYTYSWSAPGILPPGSFTDANTATPTFCADFQTAPCVTYAFEVTATDIHGCQETEWIEVNVINPLCSDKAKVSVCHRPVGFPANEQSICMSPYAADNHLNHLGHDDCLGTCDAVCVTYSEARQQPVAGANLIGTSPHQLAVYPNPFHDRSVVRFSVTEPTKVTLTVLDLSGRTVTTLYQGSVEQYIAYSADLEAGALSPGLYFIRLTDATGRYTSTPVIRVR